jgi:hypothetical protein
MYGRDHFKRFYHNFIVYRLIYFNGLELTSCFSLSKKQTLRLLSKPRPCVIPSIQIHLAPCKITGGGARSGLWPSAPPCSRCRRRVVLFLGQIWKVSGVFVTTAVVTAEFSCSVFMVAWSWCFFFLTSLLLSRFSARWGVLAAVIFRRWLCRGLSSGVGSVTWVCLRQWLLQMGSAILLL